MYMYMYYADDGVERNAHGGRGKRYKPGGVTPTGRQRCAPRWSDEARVGALKAREALEADGRPGSRKPSDHWMADALLDSTKLSQLLQGIAHHCATPYAAELATSIIMHQVELRRQAPDSEAQTRRLGVVSMFRKLRKRDDNPRGVKRARDAVLEESTLLADIVAEQASEVAVKAVAVAAAARRREEMKRQAAQTQAASPVVPEAEDVQLHLSVRSATGYYGVAYHPGSSPRKPFYARAGKCAGRNANLGYFTTAVEAAVAIAKHRAAHPEVSYLERRYKSAPTHPTPDVVTLPTSDVSSSQLESDRAILVDARLVESDDDESSAIEVTAVVCTAPCSTPAGAASRLEVAENEGSRRIIGSKRRRNVR